MKLSLEIPLNHWNTFAPFCDFHYALADYALKHKDYAKRYRGLEGEKWLDNSFNELREDIGIDALLRAADLVEPTHITALEAFDSQENIKNVLRTKEEFTKRHLPYKIIGCYRGGRKDLELLMQICDVVALPYDDYREKPLSWFASSNFHFFGMKNLDELRRHPPMSLDTSVPIRAAMVGIDLSLRERRPRGIPLFDKKLELTKEQVALAIHNIKAVKEAGNAKTKNT